MGVAYLAPDGAGVVVAGDTLKVELEESEINITVIILHEVTKVFGAITTKKHVTTIFLLQRTLIIIGTVSSKITLLGSFSNFQFFYFL